MKRITNSIFIKTIALPLIFLYKTVNLLRRFLYSNGIFKSNKTGVPTISIGNTVMGGGGKTPMVIWLAGQLLKRGKTCTIITRGYGRKDENTEVIIPPAEKRNPDPGVTGDEPAMIANVLPHVPIICCADRTKAADTAEKYFKPDYILMDDGFQHLKIKRHLDIVLIPPKASFWKREFDSSYNNADILVQTGRFLPKRLPADIELHKVERSLGDPINIRTGKKISMKKLRNKKAIIIAGIAEPRPFIDSISGEGIIISKIYGFRDHHRYTYEDIQTIQNTLSKGTILLTTFKDAVKIEHLNIDAKRWFYIPLNFTFKDGEQILKQILSLK
jgi:tetraacyldisaccharide 4'-kinase